MQPAMPVQPVGKIEIIILSNGAVLAQASGAANNRPNFNMMMETAKQDMVAKMLAAEQSTEPKIQEAPAGFLSQRIGKA